MRTCLLIAALTVGSLAWAQSAQCAERPTTGPDPVKADPGEADFQAGRTLFFQSDLPGAIDKLKAAVSADPSKTAYRLLLAKAYRQGQQDELAEGQLKAILRLNAEHVEAGVELAEILAGQKKYDQVIELLDPLLKFRHDYPLYHLLAEAYTFGPKEDLAKAREYYEQASKLNPRSGEDFYQLANIYLAESHFAKAAAAYEQAHQLGIESAVLHFKLASVYSNLRNYLGKVATAEVIGGQPGQIKNELLLLDPVPGQKDTFTVAPPASAIFQVTQARELGMKAVELSFLEANIWLNARRFAKADVIYKSVEGKLDKADQGLFWFYWAQTALGLEDMGNYVARLKKAIAAEPKTYEPALGDAYVTVARRYQQRGDNQRYIEYLTKAVDVTPLSAGLHLTLGDAQWQLSNRPAAVAQYKLVLELEPDHADRVRLLNRVREAEAPTPATQPSSGEKRT